MSVRLMKWNFTVPLCVVLLAAGCKFDSSLPASVEITCGPNGECPQGFECDATTARCRQIGSDSPGLMSADITPTIGKNGTVFTATLVATKALLRPPTVGPLPFVYQADASSPDEHKYVYTFTPAGTERETVYRISAELKDTIGNTATVPVGTVTLDFTPPLPIPGSMKVVPGVARPGQTVLVQIDFDEVLQDKATLIQSGLDIAGLPSTVKNTNTLAFRFTVPSTAQSGSYLFTITNIADLAGNAAEDISPTSQLSVESQLMVDSQAPSLTDVVINRDNFSRNPNFDTVVMTFKAGLDAVTVSAVLGDRALDCATVGQTATDNLWRCTHQVDATDTEGVKPAKATAIDLAGNAATEGRSVTLDFTPPSPVAGSMRLTPGAVRVGQTVVAQLNFTEILAAGAMLQQSALSITNLASSVQNNVALAFNFTIPVGVADGEYDFRLTGIQDQAGNVATVGALEQKLTVDSSAPTITNVQFNSVSKRYSRVTGFNQVTVTFTVSDANAPVTARIGAELMNCTSPTPTTRSCSLTVGATAVEGPTTVQLEVRDSVGNSSVSNHSVTFDFTAPEVAQGTLQKTLVPTMGALVQSITALGEGARAVVTFSLTEAVAVAPVVTLGGQPLTCTANALSYSCAWAQACNALTDGDHSLSITIRDVVGNAFTGNPDTAFKIATDCTAPDAPKVDQAGAVVWHRAPYGATWSSGRVGSRVELTGDSLGESVLVRAGNDLGGGDLAPLATASFTPGNSLEVPILDRVDRVAIWVQAVDGAGNGSPVVKVREGLTTVALAGADATATSPGVFRTDADNDVIHTRYADRWASPVESFVGARARVLPQLGISESPLGLVSIPGDKAIAFNTNGTYLFNAQRSLWERIGGTAPPVRRITTLQAFSAGRVLMFGGGDFGNTLDDTWVFEGATNTWSAVLGARPSARFSHQMAAVGTDRVLLFGGRAGVNLPEDSWIFDASTLSWRQLPTKNTHPSGRSEHKLVTLSNGNVLLFGGQGTGGQQPTDAWEFDATTEEWHEVGHGPQGRLNPGLVALHDGRAVLFGGGGNPPFSSGGAVIYGDTWVYDRETWTEDTTHGPDARSNASLFALADNTVLVFGGIGAPPPMQSEGVQLTDTWQYGANGWEDLGLHGDVPPANSDFVELSGRRLMLASAAGKGVIDAWLYDLEARKWTQSSGVVPTGRYGHQLTALPGGKALLSDGEDTSAYPNNTRSDSWVFSAGSNVWRQLSGPMPSARRNPRAVSMTDGKVLLVGGDVNGIAVSDSWSFDPSNETWTRISATQPGPHTEHSMVPLANNKAMMRGGFSSGADTWTFNADTQTWTQIASSPGYRAGAAFGVGSPSAAVMFGGKFGLGFVNETWVFNAGTSSWSLVNTPQPSSRWVLSLESLGDGRALLFGGVDGNDTLLQDTWLFDTSRNTWAQVSTPVNPPGVTGPQLDAVGAGQILMYGGSGAGGALGEQWLFRADDSSWTKLQNVNGGRAQNHEMTVLSDGSTVVFGGQLENTYTGDTWVYNINGGALAPVGSIALDQLGIAPSQVTVISARVETGASGRTLDDSSSVSGADLQLYRTNAEGPLFVTCKSTGADETRAEALACDQVPFAGSTRVAFRVLPAGYSNGRTMQVAVNSAELDVYSQIAP